MKIFDIYGFLQEIYMLLMIKPKKKKNSSQTFKKRGKIHSSTVIQENFKKETDEQNYYPGGRKLRR